jgi:hypothetical protein
MLLRPSSPFLSLPSLPLPFFSLLPLLSFPLFPSLFPPFPSLPPLLPSPLSITNIQSSGANYVQGALNWGPTPQLNGVGKSYWWWNDRQVPFSDGFHTYTMEWTEGWL